jgi:hypothetical protein
VVLVRVNFSNTSTFDDKVVDDLTDLKRKSTKMVASRGRVCEFKRRSCATSETFEVTLASTLRN